jgi:hypothetical protein
MGRPVKKKYLGPTSTAGQQIAANAWVGGDTMAREAYIERQTGTGRYYVRSRANNAIAGEVNLVDGYVTGLESLPTVPGTATVKILAYGSETGTGATGMANVGVNDATVVISGTGAITADYAYGEILNVVGGAYVGNQRANLTVDSTTIAAIQGRNLGRGYASGDYFTVGGAGWTQSANVRINGVNGAGSITSLSITFGGVLQGTKPSEPFAATTAHTAGGSGATFDARFAVNALTVNDRGNYSTTPHNPVSLTGSASGTGATATLTWYIADTHVKTQGTGYAFPPEVSLSPSPISGSSNVVAFTDGSHVTAFQIVDTGIYSGNVSLQITDTRPTSYARKIEDNTVTNFQNQTYRWLPEGYPLPGPGWAHIETL